MIEQNRHPLGDVVDCGFRKHDRADKVFRIYKGQLGRIAVELPYLVSKCKAGFASESKKASRNT
jgi:hypothetical protein